MSRYSEKNLYAKALQVYDDGNKPLSFEEFAADVNRVVCFCKTLKQNLIQGQDYNIRLLLNWGITSFNTFGDYTINMLFSVADELIYPDILAFVFVLNKFPRNNPIIETVEGDSLDLTKYAMNSEMHGAIMHFLEQEHKSRFA